MTTLTDLALSDAIADIRQCVGWIENMTPGNAGTKVVSTKALLLSITSRLESLRADLERARTPECVQSEEPIVRWETV